jgi:UDP-N-acetylglucosamine 3-dehydrogenase
MRVAVAGLGNMGRNHLRVWTEMPDVEVVGVMDPAPEARAQATRGRGFASFEELATLIDKVRPQALSIATPTSTHEELALVALDRGVHILLEKPVAPDVASAERIAERAAAVGVLVMVGHVERFNPALLELRRRLDAGQIGEVFQLQATRVGPFPPRIRDVGVVQDLATHDLDQARHLLHREIEMVFAQTTQRVHSSHEDLVTIVGRAEGGVVTLINVNWLTPRKVRETVVVGAGGMFVADSLTQDLFLYENSWDEGSWRMLQALRGVSEGNMVRFSLKRVEPLRAEIDAFHGAIRDGLRSPAPLEDGIKALRLAEATLRSAHEGVPVPVGCR